MSTSEFVYLNGEFSSKETTSLSILDRGFLFGDGVYELIPIYNKKIFYVEDHLKRLRSSLEQINISPSLLDTLNLIKIINKIIEINDYNDHYIYIHISRGVQQKRNHVYSDDCKPTVLVMGENYKPFSRSDIVKGKKAICEEDYRWLKSNIKSTSLLANVLIKNKANNSNSYEALLLRDGLLTEGSASNVFIVKGGVIKTPKLSNKLLPGITRKFLADLISLHNLDYAECDISKDELFDADEIFCSSSTNPVVPITQLDDKTISDSAGVISMDLYNYTQDYIRKNFK